MVSGPADSKKNSIMVLLIKMNTLGLSAVKPRSDLLHICLLLSKIKNPTGDLMLGLIFGRVALYHLREGCEYLGILFLDEYRGCVEVNGST